MSFLEQLGGRIRKKRIEAGMSQESLALLTGYTSRSSINKIELGKVDIPQSKIAKFAEVLSVTPAYLMGWDEETPPEKTSEDEVSETVVIYHRDGKTVRRELTPEQMRMLASMIDAIPEEPKGI